MSSASAVEHPKASTIGNELLLFLCVSGRELKAIGAGEECRFCIVYVRVSADSGQKDVEVMAAGQQRLL
jgi:hypothetical protein